MPKTGPERQLWLEFCNRFTDAHIPDSAKVCSQHFEANCWTTVRRKVGKFGIGTKTYLRTDASPTLFPDVPSELDRISKFKSKLPKSPTKKKHIEDLQKHVDLDSVCKVCTVCGANNSISAKLHKIPRNVKHKMAWLEFVEECIPDFYTLNIPINKIRICSNHFEEMYYEQQFTQRRLKFDRPLLPTAVPTIFWSQQNGETKINIGYTKETTSASAMRNILRKPVHDTVRPSVSDYNPPLTNDETVRRKGKQPNYVDNARLKLSSILRGNVVETIRKKKETEALQTNHLRTSLLLPLCGTGPMEHVCLEPLCGEGFQNVRFLQEHMKYHDKQETMYVCQICSAKFHTYRSYDHHLINHFGGKRRFCSRCGEGFGARNSLFRHIIRYHKDEPNMSSPSKKAKPAKNISDDEFEIEIDYAGIQDEEHFQSGVGLEGQSSDVDDYFDNYPVTFETVNDDVDVEYPSGFDEDQTYRSTFETFKNTSFPVHGYIDHVTENRDEVQRTAPDGSTYIYIAGDDEEEGNESPHRLVHSFKQEDDEGTGREVSGIEDDVGTSRLNEHISGVEEDDVGTSRHVSGIENVRTGACLTPKMRAKKERLTALEHSYDSTTISNVTQNIKREKRSWSPEITQNMPHPNTIAQEENISTPDTNIKKRRRKNTNKKRDESLKSLMNNSIKIEDDPDMVLPSEKRKITVLSPGYKIKENKTSVKRKEIILPSEDTSSSKKISSSKNKAGSKRTSPSKCKARSKMASPSKDNASSKMASTSKENASSKMASPSEEKIRERTSPSIDQSSSRKKKRENAHQEVDASPACFIDLTEIRDRCLAIHLKRIDSVLPCLKDTGYFKFNISSKDNPSKRRSKVQHLYIKQENHNEDLDMAVDRLVKMAKYKVQNVDECKLRINPDFEDYKSSNNELKLSIDLDFKDYKLSNNPDFENSKFSINPECRTTPIKSEVVQIPDTSDDRVRKSSRIRLRDEQREIISNTPSDPIIPEMLKLPQMPQMVIGRSNPQDSLDEAAEQSTSEMGIDKATDKPGPENASHCKDIDEFFNNLKNSLSAATEHSAIYNLPPVSLFKPTYAVVKEIPPPKKPKIVKSLLKDKSKTDESAKIISVAQNKEGVMPTGKARNIFTVFPIDKDQDQSSDESSIKNVQKYIKVKTETVGESAKIIKQIPTTGEARNIFNVFPIDKDQDQSSDEPAINNVQKYIKVKTEESCGKPDVQPSDRLRQKSFEKNIGDANVSHQTPKPLFRRPQRLIGDPREANNEETPRTLISVSDVEDMSTRYMEGDKGRLTLKSLVKVDMVNDTVTDEDVAEDIDEEEFIITINDDYTDGLPAETCSDSETKETPTGINEATCSGQDAQGISPGIQVANTGPDAQETSKGVNGITSSDPDAQRLTEATSDSPDTQGIQEVESGPDTSGTSQDVLEATTDLNVNCPTDASNNGPDMSDNLGGIHKASSSLPDDPAPSIIVCEEGEMSFGKIINCYSLQATDASTTEECCTQNLSRTNTDDGCGDAEIKEEPCSPCSPSVSDGQDDAPEVTSIDVLNDKQQRKQTNQNLPEDSVKEHGFLEEDTADPDGATTPEDYAKSGHGFVEEVTNDADAETTPEDSVKSRHGFVEEATNDADTASEANKIEHDAHGTIALSDDSDASFGKIINCYSLQTSDTLMPKKSSIQYISVKNDDHNCDGMKVEDCPFCSPANFSRRPSALQKKYFKFRRKRQLNHTKRYRNRIYDLKKSLKTRPRPSTSSSILPSVAIDSSQSSSSSSHDPVSVQTVPKTKQASTQNAAQDRDLELNPNKSDSHVKKSHNGDKTPIEANKKKPSKRKKKATVTRLAVWPIAAVSCAYCGQQFKSSAEADAHKPFHFTRDMEYYQIYYKQEEESKGCAEEVKKPCCRCGIQFSNLKHLNQHFISHMLSQAFTCTICYAVFPQVKMVHQHREQDHGIFKHYPCTLCSYAFHDHKKLKEHLANDCYVVKFVIRYPGYLKDRNPFANDASKIPLIDFYV